MPAADRQVLAEVHLLGLTAEAHDASLVELGDGERLQERFEGALEAAVAVGLVPAREAEDWRRHFDRFDDVAEPGRDAPARHDRALALLDTLAREVAAAADADRALDPWIRFEDALSALSAVGALTDEEVVWWARRLAQLPGPGVDALGLRDADVEDEHDIPQARLLRLRAVFPGSAARVSASGERTRVISLECYDDGLLVRWERSLPIPQEPADRDRAALYGGDDIEVTDDAGTGYEAQGGGSGELESEGRAIWSGTSSFWPAVPAEATHVEVRVGGERFGFDVTGLAERPAL